MASDEFTNRGWGRMMWSIGSAMVGFFMGVVTFIFNPQNWFRVNERAKNLGSEGFADIVKYGIIIYLSGVMLYILLFRIFHII